MIVSSQKRWDGQKQRAGSNWQRKDKVGARLPVFASANNFNSISGNPVDAGIWRSEATMTDAQKSRILELRQKHWSYFHIAQATGVHEEAARGVVRRAETYQPDKRFARTGEMTFRICKRRWCDTCKATIDVYPCVACAVRESRRCN